MRKLFAFLLLGCLMSFGCGAEPKTIPPEKTMPTNPGNDPAANVSSTEKGDPSTAAAGTAGGEVVTAGEGASETAPAK